MKRGWRQELSPSLFITRHLSAAWLLPALQRFYCNDAIREEVIYYEAASGPAAAAEATLSHAEACCGKRSCSSLSILGSWNTRDGKGERGWESQRFSGAS